MLMALEELQTEFGMFCLLSPIHVYSLYLATESPLALQEDQPALEAQEATESRVNAQQPTPPAEVSVNETPAQLPVYESLSTPPLPSSQALSIKTGQNKLLAIAYKQHELEKKKENERRISNMIRRSRQMRQAEAEDQEEEKALSDCDDEEWARRYPSVMERINNPKPFIPPRNFDYRKRVAGGSAISVVRDTEHKAAATREKGNTCMPSLKLPPDSFTISSRLAALSARGLTDNGVIVAISASLDWFENNPSIPPPTAAEMTSMLKDFAQSKQALRSQAAANTPLQIAQNSTTDATLNAEEQAADDDLPKALSPSKLGYEQTAVNEQDDSEIERDASLAADNKDTRVDITEPYTPPQQREAASTWANALSAGAIGSLIRTPLNWFMRRERAQQNISATEPRPARSKTDITGSTKPLKRAHRRDTPAHGSKVLQVESSSSHARNTNLPPATTTQSTPTPASRLDHRGKRNSHAKITDLPPATPSPTSTHTPASNPRHRGRPDSHLPVHLRGTRFDDLPPEWQAVSQHMKKPSDEPTPLTDQEKADLVQLLEVAKKTRADRAAKERVERTVREQQRILEGSEVSPEERVRVKRKRGVSFSADVSDSSSEEEDVKGAYLSTRATGNRNPGQESFIMRKKRRSVYDRNASPKKSYLKRSTSGSSEESNIENGHPAKKPRRDEREETVTAEDREFIEAVIKQPAAPPFTIHEAYQDRPDRARPCSFITMPPSRLAEIKEERRKWDEFHATHEDPNMQDQLNKLFKFWGDMEMKKNIFAANPLLKEASPYDSLNRYYAPQPDRTDSHYEPESKRVQFREPEQESNEESNQEEEPLQEVSNERLNKAREQALKYKPKIPSGLSKTKIMSPIHDKTIQGAITDLEVAAAIASIPENEIIAEGFGKVSFHKEGTISREATKVGQPNFT